MKQVLIAKNVPYGAKGDRTTTANAALTGGAAAVAATPDELAAGAIGVFAVGGGLLTSVGATAEVKRFFIAVGGAESINSTPLYQRDGGADFSAAEYADPVKQVSTVVLTNVKFIQNDNTAVAAATYQNTKKGEEVIVRVVDTMPGTISPGMHSYTVPVKVGEALADLTARIAAKINADPDRIVTASATTTTLTVTDKRVGGHFRLAIDGVLLNGATINYVRRAAKIRASFAGRQLRRIRTGWRTRCAARTFRG